MTDEVDATIDKLIAAGASDDEIAEIVREKFGSAHAMGPVDPNEPDQTPSTVQHGPRRPGTNSALALAGVGPGTRVAAQEAMRFGTSPTVPKTAAMMGRMIGGAAPVIGGASVGGLGGAALGLAGARQGAWAGGGSGWFLGKVAQGVARPLAGALEAAAPVAQMVGRLAGPQGLGDLAQMAEPERQDIGFLGMGKSVDVPGAHPPLLNAAYGKARDAIGRLYGRMRGNSDQLRSDGSTKGQGFLGPLQRPDGKVSSEISIGVNIDGQEVEIPSLVPTLSQQERDWLINNDVSDPRKIPGVIIQKATDFARQRKAQGQPYFSER